MSRKNSKQRDPTENNRLPVAKLPISGLISSKVIRPNQAIYPRVSLSIPGQVFKQSVVAGGLANVITINFGLILNWATRFASLFKEYCIVGCCFDISLASTATAGVVKIFFDEKDSTIPTSTMALSSPGYHLSLARATDPGTTSRCFEWKAQDYADLGWIIASTSYNIGYLKLYTDTANFGAAGAADILITPVFRVEFRGYKF